MTWTLAWLSPEATLTNAPSLSEGRCGDPPAVRQRRAAVLRDRYNQAWHIHSYFFSQQ